MSSAELREKFLEFFKSKGHAIVPSSSLIPDDPSVLLTTAGMQQFKKYYTEPSLAPAPSVASIQKCFRTSDIDEVGDESHLTFFEMLGNFSFGGYWKKETIEYSHEFITKELGLKIDYVSVFGGDSRIKLGQKIPPDTESEKIWQSLGIKDVRKFGREDNFWGPTGAEGPCGPTTEIYINGVEVWNIVFNEYYQNADGTLKKLETPGVDTGMGLERLAMVSQGKKNIFETDLFRFAPLLRGENDEITRRARIIADHLRGSVFLLADGVRPSNKEAGYILRRLLRRLFMQWKKLSLSSDRLEERLKKVIEEYENFYPELKREQDKILYEFKVEEDKFSQTLDKGLKEFYKQYPELEVRTPGRGQYHKIQRISGKDAFYFYQTFGLTPEIIKDLARDGGHSFEEEEFNIEFKKHQEISRAGQEKKFGGHGLILDTGELKAGSEEELKIVTRLHTATHLLQAALRRVLGNTVEQRGSDITSERTRFDFLFQRKLTKEELQKIEELVNYAISKDFPVSAKELPLQEAKKSGALFFYKGHYPEPVKVYTVGNGEETFSRELCGGPHVSSTGEIGKFQIIREEASSAGVRRIRAVVK